jgi:hypothetical protein
MRFVALSAILKQIGRPDINGVNGPAGDALKVVSFVQFETTTVDAQPSANSESLLDPESLNRMPMLSVFAPLNSIVGINHAVMVYGVDGVAFTLERMLRPLCDGVARMNAPVVVEMVELP